MILKWLVVCLIFLTQPFLCSGYLLGRGIYDVTGPAGDVNLMGYANPSQTAGGIHFRLRSRAFIIADSAKPENRIVYVALDVGMAGQLMTLKVIDALQKKYGTLYSADNVCISGSHSHSTPGGFLQYVLFDVTSLGFVKSSLDPLVNGVVQSIIRAHDSLTEGSISFAKGQCNNASRNRSPTSYLLNPESERSLYPVDTDNDMVVLKMMSANNVELGMINWFAVHGTSMNNTNQYLSGDNKGYASILFEQWKNGPNARPGKGKFVAGFGQSNLGDISPNTKGAHCLDTGLACDTKHSTCNGKTQLCVASGPGKDMMDSARLIGERQYEISRQLYESAKDPLDGPIKFRHTYVNMTNIEVTSDPGGNVSHTCFPAMGYSFAAGTTDGPGMFDFTQGSTTSNPFWDVVSSLLSKPTEEDKKCHWPKPILLNTGKISEPYAWDADIVPIQLFQIGQLIIASVPGEFTTMAGRRLKVKIQSILGKDKTVVIAGLANCYTSYITTFEEYQAQRYEAASTIYGPHTLTAYLQEFTKLAEAIRDDKPVPPGPTPANLESKQISMLPPVIDDIVPFGVSFGDVKKGHDVKPSYAKGDTAEVIFWSASPRNDLRTEGTFLTVEMLNQSTNKWNVILNDGDWDTIFKWSRPSVVDPESFATIRWIIGWTTPVATGTYRIRHFGTHTNI